MQTITICGSMKFYDQIADLAQELEAKGFQVHLPTKEEIDFHSLSASEKIRAKKLYIKQHMERIRESDGVVIANYDKHGILGYVGPNTLIEIAFAEAFGKTIYAIQKPGPQSCLDELNGFDLKSITELC